MESVKKLKTKSANAISWRTVLMGFGILLIPFILLLSGLTKPVLMPQYVFWGLSASAVGLNMGVFFPPVTVFKHEFSGAFVFAVRAGLLVGSGSALIGFVKDYFAL